jgi:hypothetical protein
MVALEVKTIRKSSVKLECVGNLVRLGGVEVKRVRDGAVRR